MADKHLDAPVPANMWERRASSLDPNAVASAIENYRAGNQERRPTITEIQDRVRQGSVPEVKGEFEALAVAKAGGWEIDALMIEMEEKAKQNEPKKGIFDIHYKNPKHFTWV